MDIIKLEKGWEIWKGVECLLHLDPVCYTQYPKAILIDMFMGYYLSLEESEELYEALRKYYGE